MFDKILKHVREHKGFFIDSAEGKGKIGFKESFGDFVKFVRRRHIRSNPIAANMADYSQWIVYDRISFAANSTISALNKLFLQPIGTNSKTKVDTNLTQVSKLDSPYWMNVTGIGYFFNPNVAAADLAGFLATEYMEFWVLNKVYSEGPIQCFPSPGGPYGSTNWGTMTANAANNSNNFTNGWPSVHNLYDLRLPGGIQLGVDPKGTPIATDGFTGITILQDQTFHVELKADAGGATLLANNATPIAGNGLTIQVQLHGVISRSVQ